MSLGMRIGLHTGEVIAGITGTNIVRYDIYGEDMSIANKMESSGESGIVNVSERTKEILEEHCPGIFEFKYNTSVSVLNRQVKGYFTSKSQEINSRRLSS